MDAAQQDAIKALVDPVLSAESAELVELSCHEHAGQLVVRFLVDKAEGISIQECARLNRLLGQVFETSDTVGERYTLEVSSPGLDRPLVSARDFERVIGAQVEIELHTPLAGSGRLKGIVVSVQPQSLVVRQAGGEVTVPLEQIRSAVRALRW